MSAELLREAAALMRERAGKATPGVCSEWIAGAIRHVARNCEIECYHDDPQPHDADAPTWDRYDDAEHIASWHPAVALAVADWLELTADQLPRLGPAYRLSEQVAQAVTVARAYLGRPE